MNDIAAENPNENGDEEGQEIGLLTVGDLIEQLQQYDPEMPVRAVVAYFDEEEGRDAEDSYPLMYTELKTDDEPESDTVGQQYVGVFSDLRTPDEEDGDFSEVGPES